MPGTRAGRSGEGEALISSLRNLIDPLGAAELERLTTSVIKEHRRRLDNAEQAYDAYAAAEPAAAEEVQCIKLAYVEAMLDNYAHMFVLDLLIAQLGHVPKVEGSDTLN